MAVKYWDKENLKWAIFPGFVGAPGKDAYTLAIENGYEGNRDDYIYALVNIPNIVNWFNNTDEIPTENSKHLVLSGGVWKAINDLDNSLSSEITSLNTDLLNRINLLNTELSGQINLAKTDYISKIDLVKGDITELYNLIDNINGDISDLGSLESNFSNYYTKSESYNKEEVNELISNLSEDISGITIPNITINNNGSGNVISSLSAENHNIIVNTISVYTTEEIDNKLSQISGNTGSGGDVLAYNNWSDINRVIVSSDTNKTVKDSGILITDLVKNSDLGELAKKDKIDISDCNFTIPEGAVIDSELSSTSINAVQNKVIYTELLKYYTKEEIDDKISNAGGGDVLASGNLTLDKIIVGNNNKTIKATDISISSLVTSDDLTSIENRIGNLESLSESYGTVKSVALTMPSGFSVSGSPITSSGTLTVSFQEGFSIPSTSKQSNWDTAYGWGNHASAGYTKVQSLSGNSINVSTINDEAYVVVSGDITVSFTGGTCYKTDDPVGTSSQKKCYCIKKFNGGYLINSALYD